MANPDRILEKLRRLPPDMSWRELQTLLDSLGWTVRQGGKPSHYKVRRPGGKLLTVVVDSGRSMRKGYLRMILGEIEAGEGE